MGGKLGGEDVGQLNTYMRDVDVDIDGAAFVWEQGN
jgi:hypothetical protein